MERGRRHPEELDLISEHLEMALRIHGLSEELAIIALYRVVEENEPTIDPIVSALKEAMMRCRGPEEIWMAMNLRRAMILVGGLDEKVAQEIFDQEGV